MTDDARQPFGALAPFAPWTRIDVVQVTDSTNADLVGAAPGSVLVAEYQRAGRGRLDRSWTSPPRAGLTFSAVVRPAVAMTTWGWLPLLTGVAVCDAIRTLTGVDTRLKWPNDVLAGDQKLAGILVQAAGDQAVIGVGLNVSTRRAELPLESATSLALAGASVLDRSKLLEAILTELGSRYAQWTDAGGDAAVSGLAADYRSRCATIGRAVVVVTPAGDYRAQAIGIDDDGRLRVRRDDPDQSGTEHAVAAGDIVHLRDGATSG